MITITQNKPFSFEDFKKVVFSCAPIHLTAQALHRVATSHKTLLSLLNQQPTTNNQQPIYGIHTGVGYLQKQSAGDNWDVTQIEIVASHACGVGEPMEEPEVRATIYLRLRMLAQGFSGIKPSTLKNYTGLLSRRALPRVPSQGSVGACGDLIPLAHIAHHLFGKLTKDKLGPRDGLALINGTEASLAVGLISWLGAASLLEQAIKTTALSLFVLGGKTEALDKRLVGLKKHPWSLKIASRIRDLLGRYKNPGLPQDPYSLRAVPQVLGASWETHERCGDLLQREANSITDNPVFFNPKPYTLNPIPSVLHGANFHGIYVALACDLEAWALNILGLLSERRTNLLLSGERALPVMLAASCGKSGLMMAHVASVACVSENKILTHPASADSIATSSDQEDVVPMAMGAALKLKKALKNTSKVLAIEALAAVRAISLSKKENELRKQTKLYPFFKDLRSLAGDTLAREDKPYSDTIEKIAKHFLS